MSATKPGIRKAINYLVAAGLQYGPSNPQAVLERCETWMDALGDLHDDQIERAARAWVSSIDRHDPEARQGRHFPTPAEVRGLAPARVTGSGEVESDEPVGCPACGMLRSQDGRPFGGTGTLRLRWVIWTGSALAERTRQVLCDCGKGDWLAAHHARGPAKGGEARGPVKMARASEAARDLDALPWGRLDALPTRACVLWYVVETRDRAWEDQRVPEELRAALAQQNQDARKLEAQGRRLEQTEVRVERGPRAGSVRRPPEEDTRRWTPPLRPDQGWDGRAERFGGGA